MILDLGVFSATVLMMVTVGMGLERRQFPEVLRRKGMIAVVLAGQVVVLPLLGLALARALSLSPHLVAGILLLAACPVGDITNFYMVLARGNVALSVTLNTLSCLLAAGTMAATFAVYGRVLGEQFIFAVPAPLLILKLFLMVLVPVAAGMLLRRFQPGLVARHARTLHRVCVAGVALLIVYVAVNRWAQVVAEWRQTLVAALAFIGLAWLAGLAFARLLRLTGGDRLTVSASFAVRNVALASAIAVTLLNRIEYAVFAVIYFLAEVPVLLAVVAIHRRRFSGTLAAPAAGLEK